MGLGSDIKAAVDTVRDELGTACTLNGATALGICAIEELTPARARTMIGSDFEEEISMAWAMIEVPMANTIKENDKITVTLTGRDWIVQRTMTAQAGGVKIAQRCICTGKML